MNPQDFENAAQHLMPILDERIAYCGVAWVSPKDIRYVIETFNLSSRVMGQLWAELSKRINQPIDNFNALKREPEELATLIKLLRITNGEVNAEVRTRFAEIHPDSNAIGGPQIRAARVRLGLSPKRATPTRPSISSSFDDGTLNKAQRIYAEWLKLKREQEILEEKLEAVKQEKAKYEPMVKAMGSMKEVLRTIESNTQGS